jgi:hypothetical protein
LGKGVKRMSEEKKVIHVKNLVIKADKVILDTDDVKEEERDHHKKRQHDPFFGPHRKRDEERENHHKEKHDHDDKKEHNEHNEHNVTDKRRRNFWF